MEANVDWVDRIGRRLKLRDLHILLAVVQSGSMAKAAEGLAVSQPVVSKTIADLEHTLGVRLLERSRKGIEVTPYGRALLNRGLAAFDELRQGVKEIESLRDPTAGDVRIGATEPMVAGILPIVVNRLCGERPRLIFHVTESVSGAALYNELRQRNVDFVIGRLWSRAVGSDFATEILFDEPIRVVAGTHSRWASRRKIELAELLGEPWILPRPDTPPGVLVADAFHTCRLEIPRATVVSNSLQMTHALLATGNFLAMSPRSLLQFSGKRLSLKVLPVRSLAPHGPIALVTLKNRTLSPAALLAIDCIREVAKPLLR